MKIKLTIYVAFCLTTLVSWSQSTITGTIINPLMKFNIEDQSVNSFPPLEISNNSPKGPFENIVL